LAKSKLHKDTKGDKFFSYMHMEKVNNSPKFKIEVQIRIVAQALKS